MALLVAWQRNASPLITLRAVNRSFANESGSDDPSCSTTHVLLLSRSSPRNHCRLAGGLPPEHLQIRVKGSSSLASFSPPRITG